MTTATEEIRPRFFWYWVGGGLIGLGVLVGAVLFGVALAHSIDEFRSLGDDIDAMARFPVPGEDIVTLDESGEYMVYVEGPVAPVGRVGAAAVTVESTEPDSSPLVLRSVGIDETYDISGHAGRAALRFTVNEPGDYRVTVGQVPASVTGVAIGPRVDIFGPVGSVFVVIFVPAGVGGLFVIAGAVVLIVTAVRRSGALRRQRMAAAPPVWGQPPAPAFPAGYPPGWGQPPGPAYPPGPASPPGPGYPPGPVSPPAATHPPGPGQPPGSAYPLGPAYPPGPPPGWPPAETEPTSEAELSPADPTAAPEGSAGLIPPATDE